MAFIIGDSMIKDVDGCLLTGSLNRKYIVKVRPFSTAKASDMEYYITRRDFDAGIYILHVRTNDPTLDDTLKEITEHILNIATSLETENCTVGISNIVPRGDTKKRWEQLTNYWPTSANKKKYLR